MLGSSFFYTRRNERLQLLNMAEVVAIYTENIDRTTREGQLRYEDYDPAVTVLYTIQLLLTSRREMEYVFAGYAERDSVFEEMQKAVSPGVTLNIVEPLIKRITQPAWPDYDRDSYSKAEVDRAMKMALAQIRYDREQAKKAASTPPAPPAPEPAAQVIPQV
ncbi:hypothetical protein [Hymenobacter convexus]|uniref:hypothetical protein n=1 Tax=Hymenobacter sp. CA1UV-4 TaxID=3063782 RepID=UPI002712AAEA|nr:hypothetical protein [Hymenobacter sp. CA1UV-4]MDO7851364.1 hypothetical protein [Hymenobacter sp. CA1UV-4]